MVPGHQFQAYLTLSKSCIYARNLHLEPPHTWKKQPRKKSLPNATKRLEINTPSKGICKGKNHQQKQEFTKATKTLQINTLLKGIWKGKSTYSITFNYRFICVYPTIYIYIFFLMVPCISFLCTSHSPCIYARNHTLGTTPLLGKSNQEKRVYQKLQNGLKSILLLREFAKEKSTSKNKNSPKLQERFKSILS